MPHASGLVAKIPPSIIAVQDPPNHGLLCAGRCYPLLHAGQRVGLSQWHVVSAQG